MNIRDFDPTSGQAYQGDVAIIPVPAGWALDKSQPIPPVAGRLILQEGEISGHHHAIALLERPAGVVRSAAAEALMAEAIAGRIAVPTAALYRDDALARRMAGNDGPLTRSDLVVAFLLVEHGPMTVSHEEHDAIRLPPGLYLVGRQVESAGEEERRVSD